VDVASDGMSAISGHMDGGLRLWDLKTGERTGDISGTRYSWVVSGGARVFEQFANSIAFVSEPGIHEGGIASVHFNPVDNTQVLTNSLDSTLKIVDIRAGLALFTFKHAEYGVSSSWPSRAVFSPDGLYVAAGSNSNGTIFVWNTSDGKLKSMLNGVHASGVIGVAWGRGGSGGQQVASLDRKGVLILWA
jgi:autophagy-related protein 16-1